MADSNKIEIVLQATPDDLVKSLDAAGAAVKTLGDFG